MVFSLKNLSPSPSPKGALSLVFIDSCIYIEKKIKISECFPITRCGAEFGPSFEQSLILSTQGYFMLTSSKTVQVVLAENAVHVFLIVFTTCKF